MGDKIGERKMTHHLKKDSCIPIGKPVMGIDVRSWSITLKIAHLRDKEATTNQRLQYSAFIHCNQNAYLNKEKEKNNTELSNKLKLRVSIIKCLCPSQFSILCFKPIFSNLMLQNQAHLLHSQTGSFSVFPLSE